MAPSVIRLAWARGFDSSRVRGKDERFRLPATLLGGRCFVSIWLGHVCSFPGVLYPQSGSSHHLKSLGFSYPLGCPIIADGLQIDYRSRTRVSVKVLDFVKSGGPDLAQSRPEADSDIVPSLGLGTKYVTSPIS